MKTSEKIDLLQSKLGNTFHVVDPVGELWESKGKKLYIQLNDNNLHYYNALLNKLRFFPFVTSALEAGGNNIIQVSF